MLKFFALVFTLGLLVVVGYIVLQQLPDIQRYLKMQSM